MSQLVPRSRSCRESCRASRRKSFSRCFAVWRRYQARESRGIEELLAYDPGIGAGRKGDSEFVYHDAVIILLRFTTARTLTIPRRGAERGHRGRCLLMHAWKRRTFFIDSSGRVIKSAGYITRLRKDSGMLAKDSCAINVRPALSASNSLIVAQIIIDIA